MSIRVVRTVMTLCRIAAPAGIVGLAFAAAAMAQDRPKPADPPPLSRYFPRQDLVVYAEFDGLDAHRDGWKKTAAYRVLNETTTGAMLEQTLSRFLDQLMAGGTNMPATGPELTGLGEHLLRSGFAVGINREGGKGLPRSFGLVIRGGATGQPGKILDRFLRAGEGPRSKVKAVQKPGGRTVQVLSDSPRTALAWWAEGQDLVISLVSPSGVDAMIAAFDGREPSAVDHPTRTALKKGDDAAGFEPVGLAFFDMAALPTPLPREAVALGLDRLKRIDYRWGFHGRSIESIVVAVVPAPRTGIPALFDQPSFDAQHLPPLPGGLDGFVVLSLDRIRFLDQVSTALGAIDSKVAPGVPPALVFEAFAQEVLGLNLRDEILAPLGSRLVFYTVPSRINAPPSVLEGFAHAWLFVPKSAIVLEVKDRAAAVKSLAKLAERSKQKAATDAASSAMAPFTFTLAPMQPLKGPDTGYVCPPSPTLMPFPAGVLPTLLLGEKELVFATSPATARRARELADRPGAAGLPPGDPLAEALDQLPGRMIFLSVSDTRQSMLPDVLVSLPNLVESGGETLSPRLLLSAIGIDFNSRSAAAAPAAEAGKDNKPVPAFDTELIPDPDAIRPLLFPSVSALAVDDQGIRFISRESFPSINPATAVPVAIAMLVPAAHASRIAAQRAQAMNNLKQVGLAMQNYANANKHLPTDVRGKDGKPLLSWRVQILPFMEQETLFKEFKLDEPWDSPHNKPLAERMPKVFAIPGSPAEPGKTFYRGFSGKSTIFDPAVPQGVELNKITDGTSTTIAVVEAREAIPWTRPDGEIPFDADAKGPEALVAAVGGHQTGGFNLLLCDGAVRFLDDSLIPVVLRSLITRNGGEVISPLFPTR